MTFGRFECRSLATATAKVWVHLTFGRLDVDVRASLPCRCTVLSGCLWVLLKQARRVPIDIVTNPMIRSRGLGHEGALGLGH
jgi:hypothetical protein